MDRKTGGKPEGERDDESEKPWDRAAFRRARRGRNWALFAILVTFAVLVYIVSLVRMGGT